MFVENSASPSAIFWMMGGIYVLYTYTADTSTGQAVQKYLSTPQAGNELNILR